MKRSGFSKMVECFVGSASAIAKTKVLSVRGCGSRPTESSRRRFDYDLHQRYLDLGKSIDWPTVASSHVGCGDRELVGVDGRLATACGRLFGVEDRALIAQ